MYIASLVATNTLSTLSQTFPRSTVPITQTSQSLIYCIPIRLTVSDTQTSQTQITLFPDAKTLLQIYMSSHLDTLTLFSDLLPLLNTLSTISDQQNHFQILRPCSLTKLLLLQTHRPFRLKNLLSQIHIPIPTLSQTFSRSTISLSQKLRAFYRPASHIYLHSRYPLSRV